MIYKVDVAVAVDVKVMLLLLLLLISISHGNDLMKTNLMKTNLMKTNLMKTNLMKTNLMKTNLMKIKHIHPKSTCSEDAAGVSAMRHNRGRAVVALLCNTAGGTRGSTIDNKRHVAAAICVL